MQRDIFNRFQTEPGQVLHRQISDFVRTLIRTGELKENTKLPGQLALAKLWNSDQFTVNKALATLVNEGALSRKHGLGTFVKPRVARPDKVALYLPNRNFMSQVDFYYLLAGMLQNLLAESGSSSTIFVDRRPLSEMGTPPKDLEMAMKNGDVSCLISVLVQQGTFEWLDAVPLPKVAIASLNRPYNVNFDVRSSFQKVIDWAIQNGLKSLGYISLQTLEKVLGEHDSFSTVFREMLKESPLEFRDEWFITPEKEIFTDRWMFGMEAVKKLMAQPELPEGLFIYPDMVVPSALQTLHELRAPVPNRMKLLLSRNRELAYFSSYPCSWLEASILDFANLLLSQLQVQLDGKPLEQKSIQLELIPYSPIINA